MIGIMINSIENIFNRPLERNQHFFGDMLPEEAFVRTSEDSSDNQSEADVLLSEIMWDAAFGREKRAAQEVVVPDEIYTYGDFMTEEEIDKYLSEIFREV